jgi:prolipoprotein diacylglyceryltransferase
MNAYPTRRHVRSGMYAWLSHPIYAAFVCVVAGVAGLADSPAGFWIVAPLCAIGAACLVWGYEWPAMQRRFGDTAPALLGLPPGGAQRPEVVQKLAAAAVSLLPWTLIYSVWSQLPAPPGGVDWRMAWEWQLPLPEWAVYVYSLTYAFVLWQWWTLGSCDELRRFVRSAWLLMLVGFAAMLLLPGHVSWRTGNYTAWADSLMVVNRALDAEWLALPSFHAAWTSLCVCCLLTARSRWSLAALLWCGLTALSCVLSGSHAVADVAAGLVVGALCWHHVFVWQTAVRSAERAANAWRSVQLGPVRVMSHAPWSFASAMVGVLLMAWLLGGEFMPRIALIVVGGLAGAALWGWFWEGRSRLARPFGYYGFMLGALAVLCGLAWVDVRGAWMLLAATAVAAPWAQAVGRMRCLHQGCCHGRPVAKAFGVVVFNPMSRVVALSGLGGRRIHPTQLYSMCANALIGAVLWRLWQLGVSSGWIAGLYGVLGSLARFVEEQYRGEAQTPRRAGLTIYQWLSITFCAIGMGLMAIRTDPVVPVLHGITSTSLLYAAGLAALATGLMSIDFPTSSRPFSRLTVLPNEAKPPDSSGISR